ncbi:MAG: YciI family protein [Bacteroidota bacterium]
MKQYLILLKGKGALDYSPEELQRRLEAYREWAFNLGERYVTGQRLEREGAHFIDKNTIKTDGPFLEAKEIIAGYVIFRADNLEEAIEITKTLPLIDYFEAFVRPLIPAD